MSQSYVGRTVDICVFHGARPDGQVVPLEEALVASTDLTQGGRAVTGIQKMVQRFLIILRTPRGSVVLDEDRGTDFQSILQTGGSRTRRAIEQAFVTATSQALAIMKEEEYGLPDDERIDTAQLEDIDFIGDYVRLSVRLTSLAGEDYTFIEPLAIVY